MSIKTVISAINMARSATGLIAPSKMRFVVLNINKDRIYCAVCNSDSSGFCEVGRVGFRAGRVVPFRET